MYRYVGTKRANEQRSLNSSRLLGAITSDAGGDGDVEVMAVRKLMVNS